MAKKMISWFEEERSKNRNPNFFAQMRDEDLRRNVRRIIKDMKNNLILPIDYVYFQNDKLISACLAESYNQWKAASTLRDALMFYIQGPLACGQPMNPGANIFEERAVGANELNKLNNRVSVWQMAWNAFNEIATAPDINISVNNAMINIQMLDKRMFYDI